MRAERPTVCASHPRILRCALPHLQEYQKELERREREGKEREREERRREERATRDAFKAMLLELCGEDAFVSLLHARYMQNVAFANMARAPRPAAGGGAGQ